jgi:hypothetical protein
MERIWSRGMADTAASVLATGVMYSVLFGKEQLADITRQYLRQHTATVSNVAAEEAARYPTVALHVRHGDVCYNPATGHSEMARPWREKSDGFRCYKSEVRLCSKQRAPY